MCHFVSLVVAGAAFGEVHVSLFVAGAACGEIYLIAGAGIVVIFNRICSWRVRTVALEGDACCSAHCK